jgi:protein-tyrosine phosphatase
MAEAVLRARSAAAGLDLVVASAGLDAAMAGAPRTAAATRLLAARGYPAVAALSRRVTALDAGRFDLALAMTDTHRTGLLGLWPGPRRPAIRLLMSFAPAAGAAEVPDPLGGGEAAYERALELIEAGIRGFLAGGMAAEGLGSRQDGGEPG